MNPKSRRTFLKSSLAVAISATSPGRLTANPSCWGPGLGGDNGEQFLKAISDGELLTVKKMLAEDEKLLETHDGDGKSCYAIALLAGHPEIAKLLLEFGYETDLHEAALALDWERFEALSAGGGDDMIAQVNQFHPIGGSAMYAAATGGAGTEIWRVYAKCGLPNTTFETSSQSPLQAALRFENLETAELTAFTILSNSGDPNSSAQGDSSPLHIATERGSKDIVEMLIRLGAEIALKDRAGRTSLAIAREMQNEELIELLESHRNIPRTNLEARASVNRSGEVYKEPDWEGFDQLKRSEFVGASHGNIERVRQLLKQDQRFAHGASTTGERAVEAGAHMGNRPIVDLLLDSGAPYSLPTAVMMNDLESVKKFLDQSPERIHERGAHDFPLLWYPIIGRCGEEMLKLLLSRGAEVEEQHLMGTTALHFACIRDDVAAVELLIEHGADVNRVGRKFGGKRQTPKQLSRDEKIIQLLKTSGL